MLRIGRLTSAALGRLAEQARQSAPTYDEIGATDGTRPLPAGYHHHQAVFEIPGQDNFERAREGLRTWQAHRGIGADVWPADLGEGETVVVSFGVGPVRLVAPCRIVYVLDDPDRFGFAYGTLPGHPERGEEAFVLERHDTATLFRITAFSSPAAWYVAAAGPLARFVQHQATRRYGRALQKWVQEGPG